MDKNKNQIILFSNIKGGVGKTTLCSTFAFYLWKIGMPVIVYDADIQRSLYRHREREKAADYNCDIPFEIGVLDTSVAQRLMNSMKLLKDIPGKVLIDCPGNLNDANLQLLYNEADFIIVPITYDPDTVDATGIFVNVVSKNSKAKFIFLPNLIDDREGKASERTMRDQTISILGKIGFVAPRIKKSVAIKRYSTIYPLESSQWKIVEYPFSKVVENIVNK